MSVRILMWFTVGFTVACALGIYAGAGLWLCLIGLCTAIAFFLFRKKDLRFLAVIGLGIAVGALWQWGFHQLYLKPLASFDGKKITSSVIVSDYSYDTGYGVASDGEISLCNRTYKIRTYLAGTAELAPGDALSGTFRLRLTTPGSLQGSTYHQGEGIFLLAYAEEDVALQKAENVSFRFLPAVLRKEITQMMDQIFSGEILAFARALLLGDDSLLSYETDTAFKISGIRHMIAVSGLHISILFTLICVFSGKRRVLTAVLGLPALFVFAAVVGFTPSVVRACLMQGLMILALLFDKEYDPPTSLAFAVLVMQLGNPLTITSVSFQLSVGCIIGIFLFYQPLNAYLLRIFHQPKGYTLRTSLIRWFCASVSVSASATVAATPLSAVYFGTVSVVGIVTNLLTMWIVSFLFYGIMLCCLLGAVWLPGAIFVGEIISWPIRYVLGIAKWMSRPWFAAIYTCSSFAVLFLVFAYVLLAVFLLQKKRRPLVFICAVLICLLATMFASYLVPKLDHYRVTVLDVGQGQSILFQSGGKTYLVDCGGDHSESAADAVAEELLSQGITKLDGVLITHYDDDHTGGVLPLMRRIPVEKLYLPDISDTGTIKEELTQKYSERILWVTEQTHIREETMEFTLFPGKPQSQDNESCMCILFQRENCAILLTGDAGVAGEKYLLQNTQLPKLDVLVVGHHGSSSSTDLLLLQKTKPDVAVISVGADNFYGHPSQEVLDRLNLFGCHIFRTDRDGTILFRG